MKIILLLTSSILILMGAVSNAGEKNSMKTSDGKQIQGLLFGESTTAIILCHGKGYKTGAKSFQKECEYLEKKKILCLALSFRGYPSDAPQNLRGREKDIIAAFDYLVKEKQAKNIFILGSSMGGFITFSALPLLEKRPEYRGAIILSAYRSKSYKSSSKPKLFIVAKDDKSYYPKVLSAFSKANTPKQMIAYSRGGHGQSLFNSHKEEILEQILSFVKIQTKKELEAEK